MSSLHPYDAYQVSSRNWSNNKYGSRPRFLIYLDKYQLGFTLSCVQASGSRTSHIFQGLSCLWRHNDARIIISLTWFHNLFLWDVCHFRGNRLKQTILKYYVIDSLGANPYFLPLIYWGLTRFKRSYLNSQFMLFFRNNYPSWKTSTARIYNFYSFVFSFENMWVKMEK